MSLFVDRDTFLYYLDNADVNWEATARECIAKGFELGDENKKLKKENEVLQTSLEMIKNTEWQAHIIGMKLTKKLEKIKEIAETALKANYCNNCDGVGLPECQDTECHTYALDKIMEIIGGAEDDRI